MQKVKENFNGYIITTDKTLLQPEQIHRWLSTESYWSKDIPFETVARAIEHSFCIGALHAGKQVAFARLITDYATFAYLADVYVEEGHRGKALSKKMMEILMNLDWVKTLRRLVLITRDAHELYRPFGFTAVSLRDRYMEVARPGMYSALKETQ